MSVAYPIDEMADDLATMVEATSLEEVRLALLIVAAAKGYWVEMIPLTELFSAHPRKTTKEKSR